MRVSTSVTSTLKSAHPQPAAAGLHHSLGVDRRRKSTKAMATVAIDDGMVTDLCLVLTFDVVAVKRCCVSQGDVKKGRAEGRAGSPPASVGGFTSARSPAEGGLCPVES